MRMQRFFYNKCTSMGKSIIIGAGASQLTTRNQGGGDKLQGLPPQTNTPVELSWAIRGRGGGENRNWIFCINQLGGVGRRWGAAAGPGNRGGVSLWCKQTAEMYRRRYPANRTRDAPLRSRRLMPYQRDYTGSSR